MHRLALALIAVAIAVALAVLAARGMARILEKAGSDRAVATGDNMQKVAFFLLLCLILYVSVSGGT